MLFSYFLFPCRIMVKKSIYCYFVGFCEEAEAQKNHFDHIGWAFLVFLHASVSYTGSYFCFLCLLSRFVQPLI